MGHLTEDNPKCLVRWRGKALLDWQLESLRSAGVDEIGIVTGYRRELLQGRGLREFTNLRWSETNMVSSLECAHEWLEAESCIVTYSDIVYADETAALLVHAEDPISITYDPDWLAQWQRRFENPLDDAETFKVDEAGLLTEIGNRPASLDEVDGQYMGLLRFSPEGWREMSRMRLDLSPEVRDSMHLTGALQRVIGRGLIPIRAIPINGTWFEVDAPEDLPAD